VRKNQRGETRELSFRDIAHLALVHESSVIAEKSPVFSGTPMFRTVEGAVFRLLVTGVDDSSVVAKADPKIAKGRREGRSGVINDLLDRARAQLSDAALAENATEMQRRLDRLDKSIEVAAERLAEHRESASALEDQRQDAWRRLREVDSRRAVLSELQRRFLLLQDHYASDLRRLEAVSEASVRLAQMKEERCPVCGSPTEHHDPEHQRADSSLAMVASASTAEAVKIRELLADLDSTLESNAGEIRRLEKEQGVGKRILDQTTLELADSLQPRIQEAVRHYQELQSERGAVANDTEALGRIIELETLLLETGTVSRRERAEGPRTAVGADEAEEFVREVEGLLRSWQFPGLGRVTFSEDDQDVVISGQRRASQGKGVRAITHAAFTIALMAFCDARSRPHPGMVLVDSPLIVYRQPDPGEDAFTPDVKEAFYRVLAERYRDLQVIIIENDRPPSDLADGINIIEFTGGEAGRTGFIPKP